MVRSLALAFVPKADTFSQATPHTAGVMAYYLAQQNISTDAMATKLVSQAHRGLINMAVRSLLLERTFRKLILSCSLTPPQLATRPSLRLPTS